MAQSVVVVLSSQLITTLSALAYLRWREIRGTRLLLPRLDDREGQQMLRAYLASKVVELGESIGVETRLHSEQAHRNRIRALELVRRYQAMASVRLDPLVPFDRPVEPLRLQELLEICASFRRAVVDAEATFGPQTAGVLLCLPFLRVPKWHMLWRLLGRSFGWRPVPGTKNRTYFKRAICAALRPLPANAPLLVQVHLKNETHHGLIERLLTSLRPDRSWEQLPADEPPEVRLLRGWSDEGIGRWNVLGFGTNLLALAVFLSPHHRGVGLCQLA